MLKKDRITQNKPCKITAMYKRRIYTAILKDDSDAIQQAAESIAEQILELEEQYTGKPLYMMPIETKSLHTDTMKVTRAFLGLDPKSPMYGKIIGFFTYKDKNYRFQFHVHKPNQKSPHLSNKMDDIKQAVSKELYGDLFEEYTETDLDFRMAFWDYTPLNYIKEQNEPDAYEFRKLINNIIAVSRKNDLCREFRKRDRKALKINPLFQ